MSAISSYLEVKLGIGPEIQQKIIISIIILILISVIRLIILRLVWKNTDNHKTRYFWKRMMSFLTPISIILLVGMVWISAFRHIGTFLGLLSAGIAIALKDLLENIAGWLFIVIRKPFTVGDRVQIGDDKGDVIDIRLYQFTILEVGNWVDADQSTGRIIHIPNGKVFTTPQANYDQGFKYIWNEIEVRITFDSNWSGAKKIIEEILNKYVVDLVHSAEQELKEASKMYYINYQYLTPIVYTTLVENGIKLTGRYLCEPRKIRGTESSIWEDILTALETCDDIHWAYPTRRLVVYGDNPVSEPEMR